jgi:hypothetical protein
MRNSALRGTVHVILAERVGKGHAHHNNFNLKGFHGCCAAPCGAVVRGSHGGSPIYVLCRKALILSTLPGNHGLTEALI